MILPKLASELHHIGKFGLVGIVATSVHMLVFALLLELTLLSGLTANTLAFISAVVVSYLGNRNWTFMTLTQQHFSAAKYGIVAASGFVLNGLFAFVIVDQWAQPYGFAMLPMLVVTPCVTYLATRHWVLARAMTSTSSAAR